MEVRIKFFRVDRCGYYKWRSRHAAFGSLHDTLEDISNWKNGKSISETSTYAPSEEQDENILSTYCYSLRRGRSNDYLLTTWNETETHDGMVASVKLTGEVENADIETSDIPDGYVAGYPAYFWFPHGVDGFATIQIASRLNGHRNLKEYIQGFLDKFSQYVVIDNSDNGDGDEDHGEEDDGDTIIGYSQTGNANDIDGCRPYFRSSEWRKSGNLDFLKANRSDIRKMLRRDVLNFNYEERIALWQRLWRNVSGGDNHPQLQGDHHLSFEVDFTPSEAELNKIIGQWETEHAQSGNTNKFQDVGFKLHGEQKVHWLSKSVASELFDLDIQFTDAPLVNTETLLAKLGGKRKKILALLKESSDDEQ